MALPLFKEKRFAPRKRLTGILPGKLHLNDSKKTLECRLVDVSQHGMGIIIDERLKDGDKVTLTTEKLAIEFTIAWGQPDFGKRDLFRYGLVATDTSLDIEKLFDDSICLK